MEAKYRCFEITSQEPYLTKDKILSGLKYRSIKEYAYILHDKDRYTEKQLKKIKERLSSDYDLFLSIKEDESLSDKIKYYPREVLENESKEEYINRFCPYKVDDLKEKHWHCYIVVNPPQSIKTVAKWFDTAKNNVEVKEGAGAFVDCLEYAVHQSESAEKDGKYPYDWSELYSNIDAKERVEQKQVRRLKYNKDLSDKQALRMRVLKEGMSLFDVAEKYPVEYADDLSALTRCRSEYLSKFAKMPSQRMNFYFCGSSGIGKDVMCESFARQLYPDIDNDKKLFHVVTDLRVPFEGYDGQPVIIWSDVRAKALIAHFTRAGFYSLIDTAPKNTNRNVKYGHVTLLNKFNFFNGIDDYPVFLSDLSSKSDNKTDDRDYEPLKQVTRRFPFIVPIYIDYYQLLYNMGAIDDYSFNAYKEVCRVSGNMADLLYHKNLKGKIDMLPKEEKERIMNKITDKFMGGPLKEVYKILNDKPDIVPSVMTDVYKTLESELENVCTTFPGEPKQMTIDELPNFGN